MKNLLTPCKLSLALVMLGMGGASLALTIGAPQGSTMVGRPLDLRSTVAGEGSDAPCARAQVFYGESEVAARDIDLQVQASASGGSTLRVRSRVPVDEPVVTLVLHAGCAQPVTRRSTLLADAPIAAAPSAAVAAVADETAAATTAAAVRTLATPASPVKAARAVRERRPAAPAIAAARPRLSLEMAPRPAAIGWLRTSAELGTSPSADPARRAAAIALWQAINASPEELLRTGERMQQLEREIASLRRVSAQTAADLASVRQDLSATSSRMPAPAPALGLAALAAAALGAFFWLRKRQLQQAPSTRDWFVPAVPDALDTDLAFPAEQEPAGEDLQVSPAVAVRAAPAHVQPVLLPVSQAEPLARIALLDETLQEAEFFLSLEQPGEAVRVLADHVGKGTGTSPLAWLELLAAARVAQQAQDRAPDVNQMALWQAEFEHRFGIPAAQAEQPSDGMEAHPVALLRIAASWPANASLDVLEGMLFDPVQHLGGKISVAALRELLWLYRVAQEIDRMRYAPSALQLVGDGPDPVEHFILPLPATGLPGQELSLERLQAIDIADAQRFGVDIDLGGSRKDNADAPMPELELEPVEDVMFDDAVAGELRR